MPWFKVDDSFASHPKTIALLDDPKGGPAAVGLWTLTGAWCANQLTDGALSLSVVKRHGGSKERAEALVRSGLWERIEGGYHFHDWQDWQPTRAEVLAKREARAIAGKAGGFASGRSRREAKRSNTEANASASVPNRSRSVEPPTRPDPTRPDPTRPNNNNDNPPARAAPAVPAVDPDQVDDDVVRLSHALARAWDEAKGDAGSYTAHEPIWLNLAVKARHEARTRQCPADDLGRRTIAHFWRTGGWAARNRRRAMPSSLAKIFDRAVAEALGEAVGEPTEAERDEAASHAREQRYREDEARMRADARSEVMPPQKMREVASSVIADLRQRSGVS